MDSAPFANLASLRIRSESGANVSVGDWALEITGEGVWHIDCAQKTVFVNAPMAHLLGHSADEMIGVHIARWFGEGGCLQLQEVAAKQTDTGADERFALVRKDGQSLSAVMRLECVYDGAGQSAGVLAIAKLACRDALTGLHDRRHIDERLASEISRSQRYRRRFSLLTIRLEGLADIVEKLGPGAGDDAIRAVAWTLEAKPKNGAGVVRVSDELGRYDESTFVVLATETGLEGSITLANRILARLATVSLPTTAGSHASIAASIGVASFPLHAKDPDGLYAAAARAMSSAKGGVGVPDSLANAGMVMIVDSNELSRETMCAAFELRGFATMAVSDDDAAFDELRAGRRTPDVIVVCSPEAVERESLARLCVSAKVAKIEVILEATTALKFTAAERAALRNPQVVAKSPDLSRLIAIVGDLRQGKAPIDEDEMPAILRTTA